MNRQQLRSLKYFDNTIIDCDKLLNRSDRTLLYRYDVDRKTLHVYIKKMKIYCIKYGYEELLVIVLVEKIVIIFQIKDYIHINGGSF